MNFLSIRQVSKKFGNYLANQDVSFDIKPGIVFGLLGPNGAGKTTLIRIITRILLPDSGSIVFDGKAHSDKDIARVGYMPEERGLYKNMKVFEQLVYLAKLKGVSSPDAKKRVNDWLQKFEIDNWRDKKIEELSKGMSQKIQFIATVIHEPDLLILDEPFSGLDPINSQLIENEIHRLKQQGKTIIFSTHRMEQVDQICDEIGLINKGKNILTGEVGFLKQQFKEHKFELKYSGDISLGEVEGLEIIEHANNRLVVKISDGNSSKLLRMLLDKGMQINSFQEILPTVQQLFIQHVNQAHA